MSFLERFSLLWHIIRWRLTWSRKDLNARPTVPVSSKFITAREAARLIPDGATVFSNGLAGNARCSVFFWAIRELFQKTGHPRNLTWVNVGAQGGRGKVPGTIEELALPGLMKRYLAGHLETCKAQLKLAEEGQLELYTLPQGVMCLLLEGQGKGMKEWRSRVGLGTFLDPCVGEGAGLSRNASEKYVQAEDDVLVYTMPLIQWALINAPYADAAGNIYFRNASSWTENLESARAARANGGKVMVTVSEIIPESSTEISMPAASVDYIVLHPFNEQTASIRQSRFWPMFTEGALVDAPKASAAMRFINNILKITPVRGPVDFAIARLAAKIFAREAPPNAMVNIGVGFPEEVARQLVAQGLAEKLRFTTEAGAYGGLPGSGIFFGSAIGPQHLEPSARMFHRYESELDVAVLGFLQVDSDGNVNASHRGPRLTDVVAPGGFPDIASGAHTILFVGCWMSGAKFELQGNQMRIVRPGPCKFVDRVDHITFSGKEALRSGKKVFFITQVGVFTLTEKGLELEELMPGMDLDRDVLGCTSARILVNNRILDLKSNSSKCESEKLTIRKSQYISPFNEK